MGQKDFMNPVFLRLSQPGAKFRADNAAEALTYLRRYWSGKRTREYRRAYAICQSALDQLASAESARGYVVAAAEQAGVLVRRAAVAARAAGRSRNGPPAMGSGGS